VPPEILARGVLALEAYNDALSVGTTCDRRVPVMLIGQYHSGKTSLKRSLKGEVFRPDENTTVGIDVDPAHFEVSTEVWKAGNNGQESNDDEAVSYEHHAAQFIVHSLTKERPEGGPLSELVQSGTSLSSSKSLIQYNKTQHNTAQHSTAQHSRVQPAQYSTAQHNTAQDRTAKHSTAQRSMHSAAQHSTAQHRTAQRSTAQHSTTKHSTAQHSTAQHNIAQNSTEQHRTSQHSTAQHGTTQRSAAKRGAALHSTAQRNTKGNAFPLLRTSNS